MKYMKFVILLLLLMLFNFIPANAQIINGHFNSNLDDWTCYENLSCDRGSTSNYDGTYYARIQGDPIYTPVTTTSLSQDVDVTGYMRVDLVSKGRIQESDHRGGYLRAYIGSNYEDLNEGWTEGLYWYEQSIPITGTGVQTFKLEVYTWWEEPEYAAGAVMRIDNVVLIPYPILSGYIKTTEGNPVRINVYLNTTEDPVESNDTTGYYEFTLPDDGSYAITTGGFVYDEYNAVVAVSGATEHNITLSRQLPILSTTNINPGKTKMLLTWIRNVVVSDVLIYRGTNTNQIASVSSGSYLTGYYQDENLNCESPYTYWLQPMDDDIAGPKYELSDTTTDCEAPDVFIPLPPSIPTPPRIEDDNETVPIDIIEKIIELLPELPEIPEELVEIIEETITYVSTPFNWLLLITAYIGAFIGKSIFNNDEDYAEIITSTLLLGTIGWIIVLLINFFIPIISQNEIISILIFTTSGFIIAIIASSIQPETKTRAPRRPHR